MSRKLTDAEKMLACKAGVNPDNVELCNPCVGCNFPGDCPKLGADVVMQRPEDAKRGLIEFQLEFQQMLKTLQDAPG